MRRASCLRAYRPQRQGGDRRAENIADNSYEAVGDQHRPEAGQCKNDHSPDGERGERQENCAALGAGLVDRGADRRLRGDSEQAADHGHQAGFGLAPVLLGDEEHIEIRPKGAAHIGEEEVDGIK
jgi:hypothetical protein